MRNYLHVAAAAIAAFVAVGCSNDEVVNAPEKTAISFDNAFVDKATRTTATDPSTTTTSIKTFYVYGYQKVDNNDKLLFNAQEVTRDDDNKWSYSPLKYWVTGAEYNFVAYSNLATDKTTNSISNGTVTTTSEFTSDGTTDALASDLNKVENATQTNDSVKFTFKHLLAKVKFTFENDFTSNDDVTLQVKNVKITDAYKTGTVTVEAASGTTITWASQAIDESYVLEFGDTEKIKVPASAEGDKNKDEATKQLLIIPSDDSKSYTVTFDVDVIANVGKTNEFVTTTYSHEVTISNTAFEAGKFYNLIAQLDASNVNPKEAIKPILFAINKVDDWDTATDVTYPVPTPSTDDSETEGN
jgi:hypothetical protein